MEIRIDDCFRDGEFAELGFYFAPVGLAITENRIIRACNLDFASMFGYEPQELENREFSILYPSYEEFVNIRDRGVQQLQDTNQYWDERIMARKDGSLFWCRVRGHTFTPDNPLGRGIWSISDLSTVRPYQELTRREREIVPFIVDGLTSKEIARKLDLSHRTVEVYRSNLLKKFGVANSNALAQALGDLDSQHVVKK